MANVSAMTNTMTKPLYTAEAHVEGGREHGRGRTTDGELDVQLRLPKEVGGPGGGTNPEQLFAIGYAACFEASILLMAQRTRVTIESLAVDAKVMLIPAGEGALRLAVELGVSLSPAEQAGELVREAHRICPYSNATRGNIDVTVTVNGA